MAGEGVVDPQLVRVVKTHWPERRGWCPVAAHRAVLLVRNPFDAIDSYFNMCLTNTHHLSLTEEVYTEFFGTWQAMMRSEASLWGAFHQWWLHKSGVPLFVVRYEDLRADPEATLAALDKWLHTLQAKLPSPPPQSQSLQMMAVPPPAAPQPHYSAPMQPEPAGGSEGPPSANQALPGEAINRSSRLDCSNTSRSSSSISSAKSNSSSSSSSIEGTPYTPRSSASGVGKALARCDASLVAAVVASAGPAMLKGFGYLPSAQTHTSQVSSPRDEGGSGGSGSSHFEGDDAAAPQQQQQQRQQQQQQQRPDYARGVNCRPGKVGVTSVTLNAPREPELRSANDPFGRYMTIFRKQHTVGDTLPLAVVSGEPYRLATPVYT
jgi:hypothetical protein